MMSLYAILTLTKTGFILDPYIIEHINKLNKFCNKSMSIDLM